MKRLECEGLNLSDMEHIDEFCRFFRKYDDFRNELIYVMRFDINIEYSEEKSYIEDYPKREYSISVGLKGMIHALLLNLFLRTDDKELQEEVKGVINDYGLDKLEDYFKRCISSESEEDLALINSLIKSYFKNRKNKIEKTSDYIDIINEFYQDLATRVQNYIEESAAKKRWVLL